MPATILFLQLISRTSSDAVQSSAFWERDLDSEQLLASFKREAAQVRRAVTGDLMKVDFLPI